MADPSKMKVPRFDIEPSEMLTLRVQRGRRGIMTWFVTLRRGNAQVSGTITSEKLENALVSMEQHFMEMLRQKIDTILGN